MLLATKIEPFAKKVVFGTPEQLEQALFQEAITKINTQEYTDAKIVIKGCGKLPVPTYAYVELTRLLRPVAASIMQHGSYL
jgi:hypothetical protein